MKNNNFKFFTDNKHASKKYTPNLVCDKLTYPIQRSQNKSGRLRAHYILGMKSHILLRNPNPKGFTFKKNCLI